MIMTTVYEKEVEKHDAFLPRFLVFLREEHVIRDRGSFPAVSLHLGLVAPPQAVDERGELVFLDVGVVLLQDDVLPLVVLHEVDHLVAEYGCLHIRSQIVFPLGGSHLLSLRLRHQLGLGIGLVDEELEIAVFQLRLAVRVHLGVERSVGVHQVQSVLHGIWGLELGVLAVLVVVDPQVGKVFPGIGIDLIHDQIVDQTCTYIMFNRAR